MYDNPKEQLIQYLAERYHLDGVYLEVVRAFLSIPAEYRGEILKLSQALVLAGDESAAREYARKSSQLNDILRARDAAASDSPDSPADRIPG